jgi:hypothetical protein
MRCLRQIKNPHIPPSTKIALALRAHHFIGDDGAECSEMGTTPNVFGL